MNKTTLSHLHGFFNEFEDRVDCVVLFIEDILLFLGPMHGQILNAEAFIEIGDTFRDCIDDMGDFIADNELDVFSCKLVSDEQPVFYFDGSEQKLYCSLRLFDVAIG